MPVSEHEKTPVEILNKWESVGLSEEGTFKYVLIEAYATEKVEGKIFHLLLVCQFGGVTPDSISVIIVI